jgi:hypothetical protein
MRGLISQLTWCGGPRWSNVGTSGSPSHGLGKCHHVTIEHVLSHCLNQVTVHLKDVCA